MRKIIFFISLVFIISSCEKKENTIIDPPTEISFSIERLNSNDYYNSATSKFSLKEKSVSWRLNPSIELAFLVKEVLFDVELKNEENIVFGFWFGKQNNFNKEEIILEEPTSDLDLSGNKWQFKDFDFGLKNFYDTECLDFRIFINNTVIFTDFKSKNAELVALEKAIVNGEEKTYAEFNFEGTAFGWYDPQGVFMNFFKISNGSFKGIID